MGATGAVSLKDFSNLAFEIGDALRNGFPNPVKVNRVILVDKHISQTYDSAPWNFRVLTPEVILKPIGRLPDHFEAPNHRILFFR